MATPLERQIEIGAFRRRCHSSIVVLNKTSTMKRAAYALFLGVVLTAICIALVYISNLFGPRIGDDLPVFLHKFSLQWFLGASLPGLVVSIAVSIWVSRLFPSMAVIASIFSISIFAIALPAFAIMGYGWTGELRFFYMVLAFAMGCLLGWSRRKDSELKQEAQQAGYGDTEEAV